MEKIMSQHWAIIEAMKGRDNDRLMQIVRDHLPGSPEGIHPPLRDPLRTAIEVHVAAGA
jgi:DNA-binding GntR family transcriptional regulator